MDSVKASAKIIIVGCYGLAGQKLVRLLLAETDARLVLVGRNSQRVTETAEKYVSGETRSRITTHVLDAASDDAIYALIADADLLVNATAPGAHNRRLIEACIAGRTDWIDMQLSNELLTAEQRLREKIAAAGCCFVIQAGFHPGVPAALVRYAAAQFDQLTTANVGAIVRPEGGFPYSSGIMELIEMFGDYQADAFVDGQWRVLKAREFPKFDFKHGFGRLTTYPMTLPEMRALPDLIPELEHTGLFIAGWNWFADYLVTPLLLLGAKFAPKLSAKPLGHLLSWATRTFAKAPFGTVLQLEAAGTHGGQPAHYSMFLRHEDEYEFTVIPTVSMIKQLLTGTARKPGIHMMGLLTGPETMLADMERMGVVIEKEYFIKN
ncbi:saccharopine dehydrogenase NADP-binding domain-containing protein [bacterium]|nr:saccharopine dehydrogenase NADP-binding domain-containing protein [bacterium]